jgi:hypothetical protein
MNRMRIPFLLAMALVLALSVAACQKQAETDLSATEENPATMDETAMTDVLTPEPAPATPAPAAPKTSTPKATAPKTSAPKTVATPVEAKPTTVSLPAGTQFDIALSTPVDTRTSNVGDKLEGTLAAPLIYDGTTIAEQGAVIRGEITELVRASRAKSEEDRASVKFQFTTLETVDGEKTINATVTNAEGKMIAKSTGTPTS